ncbi:hypothetical protein [Pseudoponticoccus marisrubri]|uniref:5-bromo-4-chloroindolyl phosphate hydrolysis protein n=1 Tax=Pseudoponticoccus marisrubri TaxID=1685382 RepID=A0A0W7WDV2_9RHOB|nr:hypothetical protein [Pseudoponticoccus marisrubri]KUF08762.1 hypothetical protein AVJ23_21185 [Pseudoponticoccus marisrubri]
MTGAAWHLLPGTLGAAAGLAVYLRFNLATWPREAEAGVAIALALAVFALARWSVTQLLREENRAEAMLARAGIDPHHGALRAARMVEEARARLHSMQAAGARRTPPLRAALDGLDAALEALFEDMLQNPETTRRAEDLLRRSLPRVEAAFLDYCRFAERGDGVVDTEQTRARMIAALEDTRQAAERARQDLIMASAEEADVALSVLEGTLARSR